DPVGFAVADVDGAVGVRKNPMKAVHGAVARGSVGAVAPLARAGDPFDRAGVVIDAAHRVTLRIREPDMAVAGDGDALRAAQRRHARGSAVAGETGFPGAGHVVNDPGAAVEAEHLVALAGDEPEVAVP